MRLIDYTKGPKETIGSKEWESGYPLPTSQRTDTGTTKRPSVFIESQQPKRKEENSFSMYRETPESDMDLERFRAFLENLEPTKISDFLKKFRSQQEG